MGDSVKKIAAYLTKLSDVEYGVPKPISGAVNYLIDSYFAKLDFRNNRDKITPRWVPQDPHVHIKELW